MEEQEDPPLVPPQAAEEQELHQDPSHQGMQQQPFLGFGMDPNWGGFGQMGMQPGYHQIQPGAMDQLITGLAPSMDPLEALLGPFPCARVRGLPFEATPEDVLVFFQGLVVIDVVLVPNAESGEAYVVFTNLIDYQMGLQRNQQSMGNRYLEVFEGKRSEYYAAVASQHHHWHGAGGLLGNNGSEDQTGEPLATGSGVEELSEAGGVSLKSNATGGSAWGKPGSPIQSSHRTGSPMGGPHGHGRGHGSPYRGRGHYGRGGYHGGRGYNRNYGGRGRGEGHHGGGIRDGPHTGFIRMRGLPFQATKDDVTEFFKEYKPIADSVLLTYRMDGRSTGEAYVAFETPESAKEAMELHRSTIGSRYIELFISNKEEHTRNVARSTPR
mmetsp:Transcript_27951/g.43201  ORF Transcript_27951/g.43201 Transcript_27951/m.43201 type:complete len:382 (-) Transcript_27951:84-1229(-)